HTRCLSDWSSDVCSSDLPSGADAAAQLGNVFFSHYFAGKKKISATGFGQRVIIGVAVDIQACNGGVGLAIGIVKHGRLHTTIGRSEERRVGKERQPHSGP